MNNHRNQMQRARDVNCASEQEQYVGQTPAIQRLSPENDIDF